MVSLFHYLFIVPPTSKSILSSACFGRSLRENNILLCKNQTREHQAWELLMVNKEDERNFGN